MEPLLDPVPDPVPKGAPLDLSRRWRVLACFAFTAALNNFMYLSYSTTPTISKHILSPGTPISDSDLDWTYSGGILCVCVFMMPAASFLESHNYATMLLGTLCNIGAAWLRYASVAVASYRLSLLSGVLLGAASSVIFPTMALLPSRWFPPRQQAMATSVAVQLYNGGWGMGTLIPLAVVDDASMRSFMLGQAVLTSLALPYFFAVYRSEPPPVRAAAADAAVVVAAASVEGGGAAAAAPGSPAQIGSPGRIEIPRSFSLHRDPSFASGPVEALGAVSSLRALGRNAQFWVQEPRSLPNMAGARRELRPARRALVHHPGHPGADLPRLHGHQPRLHHLAFALGLLRLHPGVHHHL